MIPPSPHPVSCPSDTSIHCFNPFCPSMEKYECVFSSTIPLDASTFPVPCAFGPYDEAVARCFLLMTLFHVRTRYNDDLARQRVDPPSVYCVPSCVHVQLPVLSLSFLIECTCFGMTEDSLTESRSSSFTAHLSHRPSRAQSGVKQPTLIYIEVQAAYGT
ncbi:hypothetical protein OH76DRAFT_346531 [Lentinus brumalis]|uniref:Uncharacterized protein n=1 Tax=Lentinus brumalis TaxID=2498619 RepID=A0A371DF03_9APHY|nr:hypothetical protein OH76DRAFT_346531 [Polyporus brumalis]